MRAAYLWLARIIALLVVVQAMTIAFAVAGLFNWITNEGGAVDAAVVKSWEQAPPPFTGAFGHFYHAMIGGQMIIPAVALLLLIVSFFAKVPQGIAIAATILVLVVLQILTGKYAEGGMPYLGLWHGLGAMLILGAAIGGATKAKESPAA